MAKKMRLLRAGLLTLLGFFLTTASYSSVEASTRASSQSSRRVSRQKIRGLGRELEIDVEGKKGAEKKTRVVVNVPEFSRPIPNPEKFKKVGINLKVAKESTKPEQKLPEIKQAASVKVNKKNNGNTEKAKVGLGKTLVDKNSNKEVDKNSNKEIVENGLEHFNKVDLEIYRRDVPAFSIKFNVDESLVRYPPNLSDYNELTDVSEEYLDGFFKSAFEEVAVVYHGTGLFLLAKADDPYTVEFRLTLEFEIPGEVPTINFIIDSLQNAFERTVSRTFYLSDLSMMSGTNPFSNTESFSVVSRPAVSAAEIERTGGSPQVAGAEVVGNNYVLISVLAGMGCVVLVGSGLMWKKHKSKGASVSNQAFSLFDKSNKKDSAGSTKVAGIYGADEDTMNYLNSIRKRYRDNGNSKRSGSTSDDENIAVMGQSGSYDDTVDSSDVERKSVEDDLRSIY